MRPIVNSATAVAFLPGQFATYTPFVEAWATSIVSYPAPALIISERPENASISSAVTLVDLTIKTSGL